MLIKQEIPSSIRVKTPKAYKQQGNRKPLPSVQYTVSNRLLMQTELRETAPGRAKQGLFSCPQGRNSPLTTDKIFHHSHTEHSVNTVHYTRTGPESASLHQPSRTLHFSKLCFLKQLCSSSTALHGPCCTPDAGHTRCTHGAAFTTSRCR